MVRVRLEDARHRGTSRHPGRSRRQDEPVGRVAPGIVGPLVGRMPSVPTAQEAVIAAVPVIAVIPAIVAAPLIAAIPVIDAASAVAAGDAMPMIPVLGGSVGNVRVVEAQVKGMPVEAPP